MRLRQGAGQVSTDSDNLNKLADLQYPAKVYAAFCGVIYILKN